MRLDPESLDEKNRARRADGDFPVVWAKQYGKGRVFNVGWGHPDTTWDNPQFQTMMLEGIKWAMGVTKADVTPKPFPGKSREPESRWIARGARQGARRECVRNLSFGRRVRRHAPIRTGLEGCHPADGRSRRHRKRGGLQEHPRLPGEELRTQVSESARCPNRTIRAATS